MKRSELLTTGDVLSYAWNNIWQQGNGRRAHDLANAGFKVGRTSSLPLPSVLFSYGLLSCIT